MLTRINLKILKFITILSLRAKYQRKPFDFPKFSKNFSITTEKSLDLGSGPKPKNPFNSNYVYGVDIRSWDINKNVKKCLLGKENIPFEENYFDVITAFDILEHIPRVLFENDKIDFPFIKLMNEIWRVLKVGGIFYSETPCYPMKEAFQDPTHVNIMTEDTLKNYFSEKTWAKIYGFFGSFKLVTEGWRGSHYYCILKKSDSKPKFQINNLQENEQ